jgi:hypothetical protein
VIHAEQLFNDHPEKEWYVGRLLSNYRAAYKLLLLSRANPNYSVSTLTSMNFH